MKIMANLDLTALKGVADNDGVDFNTVQPRKLDCHGNAIKGASISFRARISGENVTVVPPRSSLT